MSLFKSLALFAAAVFALPVIAQEAGTGLTEIVVTAQRREQRSQDIGISLSAISGAELSELGVVAATDITKSMPAVVLTQPNGPSSFSLAIRGVVQNDFADHQESPAAIYVDEVYVSQMIGLAFSTFDIDRVEVLRGPQGTLFGRNATGGLAHFITRRPTDEAGGYVDVTFGQRNLTRIEGAVNGPVGDGVDARLSFQTNHYDPLFHNTIGPASDAENGNDWAVRGQLLWKLPDAGQLLLIGRASRTDVHAGSWEVRTTKNVAPGIDVLAGPQEDVYGTGPGNNGSGLPNSGPFVIRDSISGYTRLKGSGLTAKYTRDFGGTALTIVGDYTAMRKDYQEDSDASPSTLFQFFNGSDVNQQSLEARLNGGDQRLNWTAGLYGLRIDGKYYEGWQGPAFFTANEFTDTATFTNPNTPLYYNIPGVWPIGTAPYYRDTNIADPNGGLPATRSPYELKTTSFAGFGQIEYRFTDLVALIVGARWTEDKKDYHFTWYPYEYFPQSTSGDIRRLTQLAGLPLTDYSNSRSDSLFTGKAQLDFHIAPDLLVYAGINRGVKGGGYTAPLFPLTITDLSTLTFKPEKLTTYEVGFKSEMLDHRVRLNGAAYYYDYKDYQALVYTVSLEQLIVNKDAKHAGAELELDWAPTDAWRISAGLAYVDALVKNLDARGNGIIADYTPGNAPRWTANALVRYTMPAGSGRLAFQLDGNYLSRFWFNLSDLPVVEQPAYGVANVRVNYTPAGGKLEIGASLENLADKHYGTMGFDNTSINGLAQTYPGMPRWWKVHVNYHF
jgi:iron complex outermembrane recepter protein